MNDPILMAALIALLVSANFGLAGHIQHLGSDTMDARNGTLVNVATTVALLFLLTPFFMRPATLLSEGTLYFIAIGFIVPALSITVTTMSVKRIGPGLTSGLAATSPVFAMSIAILFLGETVTLRILAGTAIVIGGIMMIAFRSKIRGVNWPLWALGLPLLAALTRGIAHPLTKKGFETLPSPLTAALISSCVSLMVLSAVHVATGQRLPSWNPGYWWFALAGVINCIGIVGLGIALDMGEVVVVSPIIATTPAFTLLLGYFVFRREVITWYAVGAIAVIFSGVMLILTR